MTRNFSMHIAKRAVAGTLAVAYGAIAYVDHSVALAFCSGYFLANFLASFNEEYRND